MSFKSRVKPFLKATESLFKCSVRDYRALSSLEKWHVFRNTEYENYKAACSEQGCFCF